LLLASWTAGLRRRLRCNTALLLLPLPHAPVDLHDRVLRVLPWFALRAQAFTSGGTLARAFVFVLDRVSSLVLPNWLLTSHGRNVP
jgi:hypothetical protein